MSEGLQQQIANLNAAQRVGIVAAVALSSFAVYAAKKHKNICGGPVDSPRHRDACPLNFLTCAPSNDINASIANIQDTLASAATTANESLHNIAQSANTAMADFDMDPSHWNLPKLPDLPNVTIPTIPKLRRQLEPLLACAHDEGFSSHPHSQSCLQCNDRHRASNALDRGYMDWSTTSPLISPSEDEPSTSASPPSMPADSSLLRCPHNQKVLPNAPACTSCAERSYTGAVDRGLMTNWTSTSSPGSPGSPRSEYSSMNSFKSLLSPKLGDLASAMNLSEVPALGDTIGAVDAGWTSSMRSMGDVAASRGGAGGAFASRAGLGKTTLYLFFWYLCTLCNDQ